MVDISLNQIIKKATKNEGNAVSGGCHRLNFLRHPTMVGKMPYVSIQKYSPDFYQPNVGMSVLSEYYIYDRSKNTTKYEEKVKKNKDKQKLRTAQRLFLTLA